MEMVSQSKIEGALCRTRRAVRAVNGRIERVNRKGQ